MIRKKSSNFYTEAEEREIARRFVEEGVSAEQLTKIYNYRGKKSIYDKVKKFYPDLDMKERKASGKSYYGLSFEKIDSPVKAYFLGLLLTDGYVQSARPQIGLDLLDEDCIKFLAEFFNFKYHRYEREPYEPKFRIVFEGQEYVDQPKRLSVTNKKSLILEAPQLLPEEEKYLPFIIRGIIDGDGSVIQKDSGLLVTICSSSKNFIEWVNQILEQKMFLHDLGKIYEKQNGDNLIYSISISQKNHIAILKTLCYYKPMGMERKRSKFYHEASETIMEESL